MQMATNHQRLGIAGVHLTTVGPLSLLFLPKCPLCVLPLLACLGVALPASVGLPLVVGTLIAAWTTVLFVMTRRQPLLRFGACAAAAMSFVAIGAGNRVLLWIGVMAMIAAGVASLRARRSETIDDSICCPGSP
jgi:hypothetical protein